MRIPVQHKTTKDLARKKVEQKIDHLLEHFGAKAEEIEHHWNGDTMSFKAKAHGVTLEGTVEITDTEMILEAKLPLIARPFEARIRERLEQEAQAMFVA
jgi:hypothetical protein